MNPAAKPGTSGSIVARAVWIKCLIKSIGFSSPMANRIVVGLMPASRNASSLSSEWVVNDGQLTIVLDCPRLIIWPKVGDRESKNCLKFSGGISPMSIVNSGAGKPRYVYRSRNSVLSLSSTELQWTVILECELRKRARICVLIHFRSIRTGSVFIPCMTSNAASAFKNAPLT